MVIQEFLAWQMASSDCPFLRSEDASLEHEDLSSPSS